jgi:hypothetical protein
MDDSTSPGVGDESGEQGIESWLDILDDFDFNDDADPVSTVDTSALMQRFALADVVAGLVSSLSHVNRQPTMDFEGQYQAGYEVFAQAAAHLEQESQRIESADAEFLPVVDTLRAELLAQRERIAEYFEEHTDRHRRFREAMVPVQEQMARDNLRAAQERYEIQRAANTEIAAGQAKYRQGRLKAFDDWNRDWLSNHLR